ncbi:uncharacterized protein LOC128982816 [Macrosteles quadrilineatus]|uniref:uncharacterized protein LOC128982816 n=1 Tax=Macrosteles quadrilineatus TaxID=74068 RepID=UPI0023E0BE45|nr:uncharacterized protein LOC128982816 [Macrosteles quadrilineatus]XP_054257807.1 uncharacterized protein LOC128982816 [Macrosteles quadrilineatus]
MNVTTSNIPTENRLGMKNLALTLQNPTSPIIEEIDFKSIHQRSEQMPLFEHEFGILLCDLLSEFDLELETLYLSENLAECIVRKHSGILQRFVIGRQRQYNNLPSHYDSFTENDFPKEVVLSQSRGLDTEFSRAAEPQQRKLLCFDVKYGDIDNYFKLDNIKNREDHKCGCNCLKNYKGSQNHFPKIKENQESSDPALNNLLVYEETRQFKSGDDITIERFQRYKIRPSKEKWSQIVMGTGKVKPKVNGHEQLHPPMSNSHRTCFKDRSEPSILNMTTSNFPSNDINQVLPKRLPGTATQQYIFKKPQGKELKERYILPKQTKFKTFASRYKRINNIMSESEPPNVLNNFNTPATEVIGNRRKNLRSGVFCKVEEMTSKERKAFFTCHVRDDNAIDERQPRFNRHRKFVNAFKPSTVNAHQPLKRCTDAHSPQPAHEVNIYIKPKDTSIPVTQRTLTVTKTQNIDGTIQAHKVEQKKETIGLTYAKSCENEKERVVHVTNKETRNKSHNNVQEHVSNHTSLYIQSGKLNHNEDDNEVFNYELGGNFDIKLKSKAESLRNSIVSQKSLLIKDAILDDSISPVKHLKETKEQLLSRHINQIGKISSTSKPIIKEILWAQKSPPISTVTTSPDVFRHSTTSRRMDTNCENYIEDYSTNCEPPTAFIVDKNTPPSKIWTNESNSQDYIKWEVEHEQTTDEMCNIFTKEEDNVNQNRSDGNQCSVM